MNQRTRKTTAKNRTNTTAVLSLEYFWSEDFKLSNALFTGVAEELIDAAALDANAVREQREIYVSIIRQKSPMFSHMFRLKEFMY